MGFTTPRDWTVGEIVTEEMMDIHIKDNLRYLKGLDGVPTIQSGLIIASLLGTEYLLIPSLTTTERTALTPVAGMLIYNETTTQFNKYENGVWRADLGFNSDHGNLTAASLLDDDHTQYPLKTILTTRGDIIYRDANTWARLAKGTAGYYLTIGANDPAWAAPPAAGLAIFGDGSDGDLSTAGNVTLTRDTFYNDLTINDGHILYTAGYRLFVRGTLTNNGTIDRNGNAGTASARGAGLAAGTLGGSFDGGAPTTGNSGGGGGGGGIAFIAARTIVNNATIRANGGAGGTGTSAPGVTNGNPGSAASPSLGGTGGAGGDVGAYTGGAGGTVTEAKSGGRSLFSAHGWETAGTAARMVGGSGGGSGAGSATQSAGAGGGGGGSLIFIYNTPTWTTETANGGAAGGGYGGAGGGSAGSAGRVIKIANI